MAGRFVLQKLATGMSRSRLIAHASASVRATAPVMPHASEAGIGTLSDVFHGAARATAPVIPCALEAGVKTVSDVFHGAAVHPGTAVPNNCSIHAYAAMYLKTSPCSSAAAKTGWSTVGMPSSSISNKKSAFVDSVGGVKQTYSSGASNKLEHSWEAKLTAWRAKGAAWVTKVVGDADDTKDILFTYAFLVCLLAPWPDNTNAPSSQSTFRGCSGCDNCMVGLCNGGGRLKS